MFLILPTYTLVVLWGIFWIARSKRLVLLTDLGLIGLVSYGVVWASYLSGFIDYNEPLSFDAVYFATAAYLCFAVGNRIGQKLAIGNRAPKAIPAEMLNVGILIGGVLGGVGLLAYVVNYFYSGLASMDSHSARNLVLEGGFYGHPILAQIGYVCGPCGLIASLLAVMSRHKLSMPTKLMVYAGFLSGPAYSITMLGRMSVVPVSLAVALLALLCFVRGSRFRIGILERVMFGTVGLGIVAYMVLLPLFRIREDDQIKHTLETLNSEPSSSLLWIVDHVPSSVGSVFVQAVAYTSSQPVMLSRFWESATVGPYWGLWQFSNIAMRGFGQEYKLLEIRQELHDQSNVLGLFGNTWATAVRDAIIDFGLYGAILQMFVFGVIGGTSQRRFLENGTLGAGLIYAFIGGWIAFSFSVSATLLAYYEMALFGTLVLCIGGLSWLRAEVVDPQQWKSMRPSQRNSNVVLSEKGRGANRVTTNLVN